MLLDDLLLKSAKDNDTTTALSLLAQKAAHTSIDTALMSHGWKALHWATYHGNIAIIRAIFESLDDPELANCKTSTAYHRGLFGFNGEHTPLHIVSYRSKISHEKKLEVIQLLINEGADPNLIDRQGKKAIGSFNVLLKSNTTTVRIWLNKKRFGHVSLETNEHYISFWPGGCNKKWCNEKEAHLHSFRQDLLAEEHPPEDIIKLNGLDQNAMNEEFLRFKNGKYNWKVLGSAFIGIKNAKNCSGLVSDLLISGGINNYINLKKEILLNGASTFAASLLISILFRKTIITSYYELFEEMSRTTPFYNLPRKKPGDSAEKFYNFMMRKPSSCCLFMLSNAMGPTLYVIFVRIVSRKFDINFLAAESYIASLDDLVGKSIATLSLEGTLALWLPNLLIGLIIGYFLRYIINTPINIGVHLGSFFQPFDRIVSIFDESEYNGLQAIFFRTLRALCSLIGTSLTTAGISFSSIACTPSHIKTLAKDAMNYEKNTVPKEIRHREIECSKKPWSVKLFSEYYHSGKIKTDTVQPPSCLFTTTGLFALPRMNFQFDKTDNFIDDYELIATNNS